MSEEDLAPTTRDAYRRLKRFYQPRADTDQQFTEVIEEVARELLTGRGSRRSSPFRAPRSLGEVGIKGD